MLYYFPLSSHKINQFLSSYCTLFYIHSVCILSTDLRTGPNDVKWIGKCHIEVEHDWRLQSESARIEALRLNDKAETEDF